MKTAKAGTMESMDCLVTVTEAAAGTGIKLVMDGASVARFRTAMDKKLLETVAAKGVRDLEIEIEDNGAIDIVLSARVECAIDRLGGAQ